MGLLCCERVYLYKSPTLRLPLATYCSEEIEGGNLVKYMYLLTTLYQNSPHLESIHSKLHAWSLSGSLNSRLLGMMGSG